MSAQGIPGSPKKKKGQLWATNRHLCCTLLIPTFPCLLFFRARGSWIRVEVIEHSFGVPRAPRSAKC